MFGIRVSFKLKKKRVRNDPDIWIRAPNSFPAIVDLMLYEAANKIIAERSARMSDEEMLAALQALLADQGALSGLIIDEAEGTPSSSAYSHRFGSLLRAYQHMRVGSNGSAALIVISEGRSWEPSFFPRPE